MVVGLYVGKGTLHGGVEPGGNERMLEPVPLGVVVVDVVGRDEGYGQVAGLI